VAVCVDDPANSKMLMVLEYVEGGSLFAGTKISPKKCLTELAARKYFRDVLQVPSPLNPNPPSHA
jgi:serine/threonine protein kinase